MARAQLFQNGDPALSGQSEIQEDDIDVLPPSDYLQRSFAVLGMQHIGSTGGFPQNGGDPFSQSWMIIDDEELHESRVKTIAGALQGRSGSYGPPHGSPTTTVQLTNSEAFLG